MKILYWAPSPGLSVGQDMGAGPHVRGVIGALEARGHHVIPVFGGDFYLQGVARFTDPVSGVSFRRPTWSRRWKDWLPGGLKHDLQILRFNRVINRATAQILQEQRPEIVYERDAYLNGAGPSLAHRAGIAHVLESDVALVEMARAEFGSLLGPLARHIERRKHATTRLIVVSSGDARRVLIQSRKLPPEKVIVKHLGVDPKHFDPELVSGDALRRDLGLDESVVVGYAGSFRRYHGVEILLEAAHQLQERMRQDVALLLVGAGGQMEAYREQALRLGLKRVVFPGLVPHQEIPPYVAAMDICVVPDARGLHLYQIKPLEYGALGKPVVAPDLPPFRELIQHGETGLLFAPGSSPALADSLQSLVEDGALRLTLGRRLRERILADFTWDRVAERLLAGLTRVVTA